MAIKAGDIVYTIDGNMGGLTGVLAKANTQIKSAGAGIMKHHKAIGAAMTLAGVAIVGAFGKAVKSAGDFEAAVTQAATFTGKTGQAFDDAKEKIAALSLELGQKTVFSASEAATAMQDLASKGFDVTAMSAQDLKPLLDLAAASQTELADATEIATGVLRAYGMENSELVKIADTFVNITGQSAATMEKLSVSMSVAAPTASAWGISLEELSASLGILYNRNIDASTAGTALRNIFMDLGTQAKPFAEKVEAMGFSLEGVDLKSQGLIGALQVLKDQGMTTIQIMEAFGKRSGAVAGILLDGIDATNKLSVGIKKTGTSADQAGKQQETFNGKMKALGSAIESVVIPLGLQLIPVLIDVVNILVPIIRGWADWIKGNQILTTKILLVIGALGIFLFTVGPLMIILPAIIGGVKILAGVSGLGLLFKALGSILGILSGSTGLVAGFIAFGTALLGLGALVAAATFIWKFVGGLIALRAELKEHEKSNERIDAQIEHAIKRLKEQGIAIDEVAFKEMSLAKKREYIGLKQRENSDIALRSWIAHYSKRTETEEEFEKGRDIRRLYDITEQEAALAMRLSLSKEQLTKLEAHEKDFRFVLFELWGATAKQARATEEEITQATVIGAQIREGRYAQEKVARVTAVLEAAKTETDTMGTLSEGNRLVFEEYKKNAKDKFDFHIDALTKLEDKYGALSPIIRYWYIKELQNISHWTQEWINGIGIISSYVTRLFDWLGAQWTNMWASIGNSMSGVGVPGGQPPIATAAGGVISAAAGRIVRVGERGEELVGLPTGSRVMSHSAMTQAVQRGSGGGNFTLHINNPTVRNDNDITRIAEAVKEVFTTQIERKMSGRGVAAIQGAY